MSRAPVLVRDAEESDAGALCLLWAGLLTGGDAAAVECEPMAAQAVARVLLDPGARILVATVDSRVVGAAYLRSERVSPLQAQEIVSVSHLQADPDVTREPVERALVECAVSWAEARGVETLVTSTAAADRDTNRFLARLGLAQAAVLRYASVAALRARLPHDPTAAARSAARKGRPVGQLVAARRSQRRARSRPLLL